MIREKAKWTDIAIVGLTVGIVVAAFLQWISISGQLQEMRNGGADTHELAVQAKNQADAAKALADQATAQTVKMGESIAQLTDQAKATNTLAVEARRSADQADIATKLEERAWVGVPIVNWISDPVARESLKATYKINNTGRTPALNVRLKTKVNILPSNWPADDWEAMAPADSAIMFPGQTSGDIDISSNHPFIPTPQTVGMYEADAWNFYAHIRVDYDDIFGFKHWTEICLTRAHKDGYMSICGSKIDAVKETEPATNQHPKR